MNPSRLLLSAAFGCLALAPTRAAEPDDYATRADFLKGRVLKKIEKFDASLAAPNPTPSVRDLPFAALVKLYTGDDPAKAEALLRHVFKLQIMDPNAKDYGMVPWQEGHPEIKDGNAVDFTMLPFAQCMKRFGSRFSPEFRQEALPHLKAAIAGVRFRNAHAEYTNIYLMQAASLLLLGEAAGDEGAIQQGRRQFDTWIDLTRKVGVTEYDSPTYTPLQIGCLEVAYANTSQEDLKPKLKACLDYLWSDIAANFFPGTESLSGAESRNYSFLYGDSNIGQLYYLEGLRQKTPGETLISDDARMWTDAATPNGYRPGAAILDLARLPQRTILSRFGPEPGKDRYSFITPDFALGSASFYGGQQDKQIALEFVNSTKLPTTAMVLDSLDSPFGMVKSTDPGGHSKPHHLKDTIAVVQDKGTVLAMVDLSPDVANKEQDNVATNLVFPVHADAIYLNDKKLSADHPFDEPASNSSVVIVRQGKAAAALRIFTAEGIMGQTPQFAVKYDGNEWGAARLVAYHYKGAKQKLPAGPVYAGVYLHAESCADDAAFADFMHRALACKIDAGHEGGRWSASVQSGDSKLEAALDAQGHIADRRINGQPIALHRLTVNNRDFAAELLDPLKLGLLEPATP